jgi:hypothetical protein
MMPLDVEHVKVHKFLNWDEKDCLFDRETVSAAIINSNVTILDTGII